MRSNLKILILSIAIQLLLISNSPDYIIRDNYEGCWIYGWGYPLTFILNNMQNTLDGLRLKNYNILWEYAILDLIIIFSILKSFRVYIELTYIKSHKPKFIFPKNLLKISSAIALVIGIALFIAADKEQCPRPLTKSERHEIIELIFGILLPILFTVNLIYLIVYKKYLKKRQNFIDESSDKKES